MRTASRRVRGGDEGGVDLTPMLDVVFILLIFFLVTASFTREAVVDISRPDTAVKTVDAGQTILVTIGENDQVWVEGRYTDPRLLRAHVSRFLAEKPEATVAIRASEHSRNETLVTVIDQARLAGAANVALAEPIPAS